MKNSLVGVAVLAALIVGCSKTAQEHAAMSPVQSSGSAPRGQSMQNMQNAETQAQHAPAQTSSPPSGQPTSPAPVPSAPTSPSTGTGDKAS